MITCDCGHNITVRDFRSTARCTNCGVVYLLDWDESTTDDGDEYYFFIICGKQMPEMEEE